MLDVWKASGFLDAATKNTKYLFRLSGYARSGQHAISNWIMSHAPFTSLWVNNIHEFGEQVDFQHYWYGPVNLETLHFRKLITSASGNTSPKANRTGGMDSAMAWIIVTRMTVPRENLLREN